MYIVLMYLYVHTYVCMYVHSRNKLSTCSYICGGEQNNESQWSMKHMTGTSWSVGACYRIRTILLLLQAMFGFNHSLNLVSKYVWQFQQASPQSRELLVWNSSCDIRWCSDPSLRLSGVISFQQKFLLGYHGNGMYAQKLQAYIVHYTNTRGILWAV